MWHGVTCNSSKSLKMQEKNRKINKVFRREYGHTQIWTLSCSVLGVPHGLKKGNSILRRLECLAGSFVAAAFVVDFEAEGVLEQQGETNPLTELVLAECNCRGKFFSRNKCCPWARLVSCSSPELFATSSCSSVSDRSIIVPYCVWSVFISHVREIPVVLIFLGLTYLLQKVRAVCFSETFQPSILVDKLMWTLVAFS